MRPSHYDPAGWKTNPAKVITRLRRNRPSGLRELAGEAAASERGWRTALRRALLVRQARRCAACGVFWSDAYAALAAGEPLPFEVDHRIPLHQDGAHHVDNLQLVCRGCHQEKHRGERAISGRAAA